MMKNSKKLNKQSMAVYMIAILLVLASIINVTLAYFSDSAKTDAESGIIKFGAIAIKASVAEEPTYVVQNGVVKFSLTADEVSRETAYRTLVIENAPNKQTEDFAIRLSLSTNVAGNKVVAQISSVATDYIDSEETVASNWLVGTDNKYYFSKFINLPTSKKVYIPIKIDFDSTLSAEDLSANSNVSIGIEVIQAAHDGYKSWETKPASLNITQTYTPAN